MRKFHWFFGVAAAAMAVPATVQAQSEAPQSAEDANNGSVIIVTARKREENLVDVPMAISVFSEENIEKGGITDVTDLAAQTPGFDYREGFGRLSGDSNNRPSIRGMSSILGEPNAAFFVDGIFVSGPITGYSLDNLQRVEVVRGPQSALFGRGTFGGAINFVTKRPSMSEWGGEVFGKAAQHDNAELRARISGPLVENVLAIEINARHYEFGGDYFNEATGRKDLSDEQTQQIGAKILFEPTTDLSIYVDAAYSEDRDGGFAYGLWNGGNDNQEVFDPNQSNCFTPAAGVRKSVRTRGYYCGAIGSFDSYYYNTDGRLGVHRDQFRLNTIIDYNIGDWTVTSLTGYTDVESDNTIGTIYLNTSNSRDIGGQSYLSQELRVASPTDRRIRTLFGGYYFKEKSKDTFSEAWNPFTGGSASADSAITFVSNDSSVTNYAAFGSVEFDVTDRLSLSAEARYQEEKLKLAGEAYDNPLTPELGDDPDELKFTAFLPRASLRYELTDDWNIYGSVAKGNQPGGYNEAFFEARYNVTERANFVNEGKGEIDESDVWSYELGVKGQTLDGVLGLNVAAYYLDWTKQALSDSDALRAATSTTQSTIVLIQNAGKSEVKGFELEASIRPTDFLYIGLGYAYSDAKFKDYFDENLRDLLDTNGYFTGPAVPTKAVDANMDGVVDNAPGVLIVGTAPDGRVLLEDTVDPSGQVAGNFLPQTPKHMLNATMTFTQDLNDDMTGFFRADYTYASKRYVQAANLAWVGSSSKLNLRAGVENDRYSFSVFVNNVTQEDTPEVATRLADFRQFFFIPDQTRTSSFGRGTFLRDFTATAPRKRQFGVEGKIKF